MSIFKSRIFKLAFKITFLLNKYFILQIANELLSKSRKLDKQGFLMKMEGLGIFLKKKGGGRLLGTRE